MMRVLFLTNIPSPYRVDFFQELGKLCELTVLYELESASDRDDTWKRKVRKLSYQEIYLKPIMRQASSAFCPSVKIYLKKKDYDVVIVGVYSTPTGMYAIHYMKRKHMPYWISCDGGMVSNDSRAKYQIKKYFLSDAAGYFSSAGTCDEYLIHYGAEKKKIYRYPFTSVCRKDILGISVTEGEKQRCREALQMQESFIFLTVGQFIYRKGYDLLLKAAEGLSGNAGIYIVGGEPTEEYLELQKKSAIKNVHFIGFQNKNALQKYYRAADVFVFPTREDIWGLVVNEAMANGLPVITTNRCAAGMELIRGNGRIISVESVGELRDAMKGYEGMEKRRLEDESERSLEIIKKYSIEDMAEEYINVLKKYGK